MTAVQGDAEFVMMTEVVAVTACLTAAVRGTEIGIGTETGTEIAAVTVI